MLRFDTWLLSIIVLSTLMVRISKGIMQFAGGEEHELAEGIDHAGHRRQ